MFEIEKKPVFHTLFPLLQTSKAFSKIIINFPVLSDLLQRARSRERERERLAQRTSLRRQRSRERDTRRTLSYDATPFYMPADPPTPNNNPSSVGPPSSDSSNDGAPDNVSQYRRQLGERLYPKVRALQPVGTYNTDTQSQG